LAWEPPNPKPADGSWNLLEGPPPKQKEAGQPPEGGPGQNGVPWSAKDIFAIIGLVVGTFLGSVLLIQVLLVALLSFRPDLDRATLIDSPLLVTALMVLQWVIVLAVPLLYFKIRGYALSAAVLGFRRTRVGKALLWLLLIMVVTSIYGQAYDAIIERFFGPEYVPSKVPSQDVTTLYGSTALAVVLTFIAVALITPVVEELFFRGIVHRGLEKSLGFLPGATLSALIFALAHFDWRLYAPIFGLGFGFAFLVHKTGSIWPSIAGHFIINSLGVIAQYTNLGNGQ
jgi:membrane protease YdiL (CAAX protease family)